MIAAAWAVVLLAWWWEPKEEPEKIKETEIVNIQWEPVSTDVIPLQAETTEEKEPEFIAYDDVPLPEDIQIFMQEQRKELDISYEFALALMETESSFMEDAVGDGGRSVGRMQINQCNWQRMQDEYGLDVHDAEDNVAAGLVILRELFDNNSDPYYVILCYKAGIGRGAELYEQKIFKGDTYDCEALCEKAEAWERAHGK